MTIPYVLSAVVTALICTAIGVSPDAAPAAMSSADPDRQPFQQQVQLQFIVVPAGPTEAEMHDNRVREQMVANARAKGTGNGSTER